MLLSALDSEYVSDAPLQCGMLYSLQERKDLARLREEDADNVSMRSSTRQSKKSRGQRYVCCFTCGASAEEDISLCAGWASHACAKDRLTIFVSLHGWLSRLSDQATCLS